MPLFRRGKKAEKKEQIANTRLQNLVSDDGSKSSPQPGSQYSTATVEEQQPYNVKPYSPYSPSFRQQQAEDEFVAVPWLSWDLDSTAKKQQQQTYNAGSSSSSKSKFWQQQAEDEQHDVPSFRSGHVDQWTEEGRWSKQREPDAYMLQYGDFLLRYGDSTAWSHRQQEEELAHAPAAKQVFRRSGPTEDMVPVRYPAGSGAGWSPREELEGRPQGRDRLEEQRQERDKGKRREVQTEALDSPQNSIWSPELLQELYLADTRQGSRNEGTQWSSNGWTRRQMPGELPQRLEFVSSGGNVNDSSETGYSEDEYEYEYEDEDDIFDNAAGSTRNDTGTFTIPDLEPRPRKCQACLDVKPINEFPAGKITNACDHANEQCLECVAQWLAVQLKNKSWNAPDCPICLKRLGYEDVKQWAPPGSFERYDIQLSQKAMEFDPNFHWCGGPGCSSGQVHYRGADEPIMTCTSCARRICVIHKTAWHDGKTCREVDQAAQEAVMTLKAREKAQKRRDKEDTASKMKISKDTKPCPGPRCGVRVEKGPGCKHMECTQCRYQWCWTCNKKWVKGHLDVKC